MNELSEDLKQLLLLREAARLEWRVAFTEYYETLLADGELETRLEEAARSAMVHQRLLVKRGRDPFEAAEEAFLEWICLDGIPPRTR